MRVKIITKIAQKKRGLAILKHKKINFADITESQLLHNHVVNR
jgi:hypothetical protein